MCTGLQISVCSGRRSVLASRYALRLVVACIRDSISATATTLFATRIQTESQLPWCTFAWRPQHDYYLGLLARGQLRMFLGSLHCQQEGRKAKLPRRKEVTLQAPTSFWRMLALAFHLPTGRAFPGGLPTASDYHANVGIASSG